MKHKIFTLFLALIASAGTIFAESGTCGANLTWDLTDGVLTISGTGAMTDYDYYSHAPWYDYRSSITSVIIEDGVTSIGFYAFQNCSSLPSVTIPNSVTSIGGSAFSGCSSLTSVTIPNSVTSIGSGAFNNCSKLTSIDVASENPNYSSVDGVLFNKDKTELIQYPIGNARTEYTISNSVTSIGSDAFYNCSSLTSVTIPNSVTSIGGGAFRGCRSLTSVTIPSSVTSIGGQAFAGCSSLTSVTIPNSVTSIGDYAFYECTSLTAVTIGNSVTSIGGFAFAECNSLTSVTIPNSVTSIGGYAFDYCRSLTSVTIPNSVTSIGKNAFYLVNNVVYSGSATGSPWGAMSVNGYVDGYLVYSDASKTTLLACSAAATGEITIPNSVTSIGDYAFYECTCLTAVTIVNSVTSIGTEAFSGCSSLTTITCEAAAPPTCGEYVFDYVDESVPLYVPAGSVGAYKAADQWEGFGDNIQPIQAPEADVTDVDAEPTDNAVVIAWPAVTGATVYTINIYKGSDLICTLSFNGLGQLLSISLAKKANGGNPKTAVQTATGWQYSIDGLETGTTYSCTVIAKNGETPLYSKTVSFTTSTATAIDQITNDKSQMANKIIKDNQLLIIRDGKTYSVQGAEVQ